MKFRIIASVLLVMLLSISATKSEAAPWRGGYGRGWCAPHPIVRVYAPSVVIGGGCYGGCYARPHYYAPRYCAPHYAARGYYGGGYRHCR